MTPRFSFFAPNDDLSLMRWSGWWCASVVLIMTLVMPAIQIWHAGQHEHGPSVDAIDVNDVNVSHHQGLFASKIVTSFPDTDNSPCSLCQILASRNDVTPGDHPPVVSTTIFLVTVIQPALRGHQWSMPARAPPARSPPTIA